MAKAEVYVPGFRFQVPGSVFNFQVGTWNRDLGTVNGAGGEKGKASPADPDINGQRRGGSTSFRAGNRHSERFQARNVAAEPVIGASGPPVRRHLATCNSDFLIPIASCALGEVIACQWLQQLQADERAGGRPGNPMHALKTLGSGRRRLCD